MTADEIRKQRDAVICYTDSEYNRERGLANKPVPLSDTSVENGQRNWMLFEISAQLAELIELLREGAKG